MLATFRGAVRRLGGSIHQWLGRWVFNTPELIPLHLTWIFTAVLAVFAVQAWRDAKEAGEKTSAQLDLIRAEQRPWLDVKPNDLFRPYVMCQKDHDTYILEVPAEVHNIGKAPGFDVASEIAGEADSGDGGVLDCNSRIGTASSTILPDQKSTSKIVFTIHRLTIELMRKDHHEEGGLACISYVLHEGGKIGHNQWSTHQTNVDVKFILDPNTEGASSQLPANCESVRLTDSRVNFAD